MRKALPVISLLLALIIVVGGIFAGCGQPANAATDPMFIEVDSGYCYYVVYHRDTKVMYAVSDGSKNRGNFTVLVNPDGSPMLWED